MYDIIPLGSKFFRKDQTIGYHGSRMNNHNPAAQPLIPHNQWQGPVQGSPSNGAYHPHMSYLPPNYPLPHYPLQQQQYSAYPPPYHPSWVSAGGHYPMRPLLPSHSHMPHTPPSASV